VQRACEPPDVLLHGNRRGRHYSQAASDVALRDRAAAEFLNKVRALAYRGR